MPNKINPYTLQFGKNPIEMIPRFAQITEIENALSSEVITQQIYMITGIRGSGKTVFMTTIADHCKKQDWIIININISSTTSIIEQILVELSNHPKLKKHLKLSSISLSSFGLNIQVDQNKTSTVEHDIRVLLELANKNNYRVLITIDEVTNTLAIREFAGASQIWVREKLPVFLLMAGLYENIRELRNEKSLTFLYRSPRIDLSPLQMLAIKENYQKTLNVTDEQARTMAQYTKGYSFAFQALGHIVWNLSAFNDEALRQYKIILSDLSYEKIWDECSPNDRKVCKAIADSKNGSYKEICSLLNWKGNQLNPYRKRLIDKQIIRSKGKGFVAFTLPYFDEYVINNEDFLFDF